MIESFLDIKRSTDQIIILISAKLYHTSIFQAVIL